MRAILTALIDIAQRTGRFTVAEATDLYTKLWVVIGLALVACGVAFWTNALLGWTTPSLLLAIAFVLATLFLWAKPLNILVVAGVGLAAKVATHATVATEVRKVLEEYLNFLKWFLVVGITFLFVTGTISFQQHPTVVLVMVVAVGIMWIFTWMWPHIFIGTWGRRLIYAYAVVMIGVSLGSLIPGPVWVKYTGWDPVAAKPTSTEEGLYRLTRARQGIDDADRAKELERITGKVERREALTQAEERFIVEAKQSQLHEKASQPAPVSILSMPANDNSPRLPTIRGRPVTFHGSGFNVHMAYADGSECIMGGTIPCKDGDILYFYLRDLTGKPNQARYEVRDPR